MPASDTPQKPGLIGLDIGHHNLHLCQLRAQGPRHYSIIAKSSVPFDVDRQQLLDDPKTFKRYLARAIKGKSFKGRKITAIMPPDEVRIMLLTYKASVSDVEQEVVRMLSQRVDGDIRDYVIDYLPVRTNSSDEEHIVMASVARRDKVERLLNTLTRAGLQVHSLDTGPSALRRLISVLYTEDKTSNVLLINTGDETSYLTIVSGRRLLFDQPVKFGCRQILQEIANTLEIDIDKARQLVSQHGFVTASKDPKSVGLLSPSDISQTLLEIAKPTFLHLIDEINRVLIYTASETHGVPLSRVSLLGCLARWPGAQDLMMSLLDIEVEKHHIEFHEVFRDESEVTAPWIDQFPEMAIATGLALRGLQQDE